MKEKKKERALEVLDEIQAYLMSSSPKVICTLCQRSNKNEIRNWNVLL